MEIPGSPYSLRVDLPLLGTESCVYTSYSSENISDMLGYFKSFSKMSHYLVAYEISAQDKPHLQCIVWFPDIISQTTMSKYRNWWKLKYASQTTKQPVSFTKSIKPDSLLQYCMKDKSYVSNISSEILDTIPEWRDKLIFSSSKKIDKRKQFLKLCSDHVIAVCLSDELESQIEYGFQYLPYLTKFSEIYYGLYKSPIRRCTAINALIHTKLLSHSEYIRHSFNSFFSP